MCLIETFRRSKGWAWDEASPFSSYVLQRSMGPNVFLDSHSETKEDEYSLTLNSIAARTILGAVHLPTGD